MTTLVTRKIFYSLCAFALAFELYAGTSFGSLNINQENQMLFTVTHDNPGAVSYSSLFLGKIKDGRSESFPEILTCFPEQMEVISGGKKIQIRNRYGTAIYNLEDDTLSWLQKPLSFPVNATALSKTSVSPDGKWICYISQKTSASGKLILQNVEHKKNFVLDANAVFSYTSIPVKWSLDGTKLLYEKNGSVYFCLTDALSKGINIEEKYRRIGKGTINSVEWAGTNFIAYVDEDLVYRISTNELASIGMYAGLIRLGKIVGRLPEKFNPQNSFFETDDKATSFVIINKSNFILYCRVKSHAIPSDYLEVLYSKPYSLLSDSVVKIDVEWPLKGNPVVWTDLISSTTGKRSVEVFLFSSDGQLSKALAISASEGIPSFSPDGAYVAFSSGNTVYVYSTNPWTRVATLEGEKCVSLQWCNEDKICVGGEETVKLWNIKTLQTKLLFLSSAETAGWQIGSVNKIIANTKTLKNIYSFNAEKKSWKVETASFLDIEKKVQNNRFRIFKGTTKNALYNDAIYVRSLADKTNTTPFLNECVEKTLPRKKVALVFDAIDNVNGLSQILSSCQNYKVRPTFFINGEFIRRYPVETKQIVAAGYECASMFFAPIDLTEKNFVFDENFIRRGLARNEDEFFSCTGSELSLYWHAPFYKITDAINEAGQKSSYTLVNVLPGITDSSTFEAMISNGKKYYSSAEIIDIYMHYLKNGYKDKATGKYMECKVLPVTVGLSRGNRSDYLYEKLDILINSIHEAGFEIVPVSEL